VSGLSARTDLYCLEVTGSSSLCSCQLFIRPPFCIPEAHVRKRIHYKPGLTFANLANGLLFVISHPGLSDTRRCHVVLWRTRERGGRQAGAEMGLHQSKRLQVIIMYDSTIIWLPLDHARRLDSLLYRRFLYHD